MPQPGPGQFLVRNIWMSVDPYMRGRMMDRESYVPPFQIGAPLDGGSVGQVVESQHDGFAAGDYVCGFASGGWREYWVSDGTMMQKVDPAVAPLPGVPRRDGHAGHDRLHQSSAHRRAEGRARRSSYRRPPARSARSSVRSPSSRAASVVGSVGSDDKVALADGQAGIDAAINYRTCGDLLRRRRARPARRASTSTSRTSAASTSRSRSS